jgi:hypothetical protein
MTAANKDKPGLTKDKHGISLDEKAQEQPTDKDRDSTPN